MGSGEYCDCRRSARLVTDSLFRSPRELPFDRVLGEASAAPAVLYGDIGSPLFNEFHQKLSALARDGQVSYRVRYRPPQHGEPRPLFVSGYGVELALKRTDYIVIDDREAEPKIQKDSKRRKPSAEELKEEEDSPADLKPLSSSEVLSLGLNAASFVMNSDNPLETLQKLSQDFPKHSSAIAAYNATDNFLNEFRSNRAQMLPAGHNVMWINGIQIDARQIDAFSLLEHLRRERKLIAGFRNLGLSAQEAVSLLSHEAVAETQVNNDPQRYDYRDNVEGGHVIIWLNDLEKDRRYEAWPSSLAAVGLFTVNGTGQFDTDIPSCFNAHTLGSFLLFVEISTMLSFQLTLQTLPMCN